MGMMMMMMMGATIPCWMTTSIAADGPFLLFVRWMAAIAAGILGSIGASIMVGAFYR